MAVTVQGAQIDHLSVSKNDKGEHKVEGSYVLMSSTGKVLAKQKFNGYGDVSVSQSPQTAILFQDFLKGMQSDLNTTLGLE